MKTQFDHILQSSFYLWLEFKLGVIGEAYKTTDINFIGGPEGPNMSNDFLYSANVPEGMVAYHSPYRQFFALEDIIPDTEFGSPPTPQRWRKRVKINGNPVFEYPDSMTSKDQVLIDYNNGRVLLDKATFGTTSNVQGSFNVKTFNTYFTTEDEESILINSDFLLQNASLQTYLESKNKLGDKAYTVPAAFTTTSRSLNKPFAFGGLDETVSTITIVLVTNTNYELDFALSLLRDTTHENFPIVPFERFPYGEYFSVKPTSRPYKYREFCSTCLEKAYIKSISSSKLSDRTSKKIQKDLKVGFVDFEILSVRQPRITIEPEPQEVGDVFETCVVPTPTSSETIIPQTPTETPPDHLCIELNLGTEATKKFVSGTYYSLENGQPVKDTFEQYIPKYPNGNPQYKITAYHSEIWSNTLGGIDVPAQSQRAGISFINYTRQPINDAGQNTTPAARKWGFVVKVPSNSNYTVLESISGENGDLWDAVFVTPTYFDFTFGPCGTPTSTTSLTSSYTPTLTTIYGDEFGLCSTPTVTYSPSQSITFSETAEPGDEFDICPTTTESIDFSVCTTWTDKEKQQFFGVKGTFHDRPWWGLESLKNINASSGQKSQKLDP